MITRFVLRWLLPLALVLGAWEAAWWWGGGVRPISPWALEALLRQPGAKVYLADVRLPAEYRLFRLPGAQSHPELVYDQSALVGLPRETPVVLVCMTGHRSSVAGWELRKMGFSDVRSLTGGTLGWYLTLHPVERGKQAPRSLP